MDPNVDLSPIYWIVGAMVVMNLGTIISVLVGVGKGVWWLSKLDARVLKNTQDIDAAHEKIRKIKEIYGQH